MTSLRDILSIQYRAPNIVSMALPKRPGVEYYEVRGAARLNDAYGNAAGVGGFGTVPMFQVRNGGGFRSRSVQERRLPSLEETVRDSTRMFYDPDDFATPFNPAASYLPGDGQAVFLRVAAWDRAAGAFMPEGPICIVPVVDYFTAREPTFTVTGIAPSLGIGAFPTNLPDVMPPESMNFRLPAASTTVSIENLDGDDNPLLVAFNLGTPPTVIPAGRSLDLRLVSAPEFFVASPNGNPWFTVRVSTSSRG